MVRVGIGVMLALGLQLGVIQVLRNADGGGGCQIC